MTYLKKFLDKNEYNLKIYSLNFEKEDYSKGIYRELIQKYSQKWYDTHIEGHKLIERKLIYSYESIIKYELERKNKKKAKEFAGENEDFNDYSTTKKLDINKFKNYILYSF